MMVVNSQQQQQHYYCAANDGRHAMECRQQQQHRRSKGKVQQYHPTMTSMTQEAKIPVYNGGGQRFSPSKVSSTSRSPPSRASPGTMAASAYAGAKFSAAPPSPHALPKPPISWWVNPPIHQFGDSTTMSVDVDPLADAANSYGNLISNQLKLLLNVQA